MSTVMSVSADTNVYVLENGSARKSMTSGETWQPSSAAGPFDATAFSKAYGLCVTVISGTYNYRVDGSTPDGSNGTPVESGQMLAVRAEEYDRLKIYATANAVLECSLLKK